MAKNKIVTAEIAKNAIFSLQPELRKPSKKDSNGKGMMPTLPLDPGFAVR